MTDVQRDAIAAALDELGPPVPRLPSPATGLGYGTDLSLSTDLTDAHDVVEGGSRLAIAQAITRRLSTPRGSLLDAPNYGLDVRGYLNRGVTDREINGLAERIRAELAEDDRIRSVSAVVTPSDGGRRLAVALRVVPADVDGPFRLVLVVTSAAVLLEELSA